MSAFQIMSSILFIITPSGVKCLWGDHKSCPVHHLSVVILLSGLYGSMTSILFVSRIEYLIWRCYELWELYLLPLFLMNTFSFAIFMLKIWFDCGSDFYPKCFVIMKFVFLVKISNSWPRRHTHSRLEEQPRFLIQP